MKELNRNELLNLKGGDAWDWRNDPSRIPGNS